MVSLWCVLTLLTFLSLETSGANPGVTVRVSQKGLDHVRQIGHAAIQNKLQTIQIADVSGTERVKGVGKVSYSLTGIRVQSVGLPKMNVGLVPNTGVSLSISDAFISLRANWRIRAKILKQSGSVDLSVSGLRISTSIGIHNDGTGRPMVSCPNCASSVDQVNVKFHGGASWLINLFKRSMENKIRKAIDKQICSLIPKAIDGMNSRLKTLNVLARVDKFAEIDYSMAGSPIITSSTLDLSLKGQFYNIGQHKEPPFSATPFTLPAQDSKMLYFGLSAFTLNSASFVYNVGGKLSTDVTDDKIPSSVPIRLNTKTLGTFIPEIAKQFPGLKVKLQLQVVKEPNISFEPNSMTLQASSTVTAYAVQPDGKLSSLFVLSLVASVSGQIQIRGLNVVGTLSLNKIDLTLAKSYVGSFEVKSLDSLLTMVMKTVVIPAANVFLQQGYPLPALKNMNLVNPQLQIMKDYALIGTDVQFTG